MIGNLLNMALTLLPKQVFQYYVNSGRKLQPNGQYLATYDDPLSLSGSVQPVPKELYEKYGLDFAKNYFTFFVSQNAMDITRNLSGDAFLYNNAYFQCVQKTDWFAYNGWDAVLAIQVPSISGINSGCD
jgi:hypothetical protein